MTLNKKSVNIAIGSFFVIVVVVIGFLVYQQKASADTVVPGFATAHVFLKITVPTAQQFTVKATFNPTDGTKKFYFKERTFDLTAPGLNTIDWYIRKIPAGSFSLVVTSGSNTLSPSPIIVPLTSDQVNETAKFELNLGEPPVTATVVPQSAASTIVNSSATASATSTIEPTSETSSTTPLVPPVPELPTLAD